MLSVVVWLWRGTDPRRVFLPEYVNIQQSMFARTLTIPHRFICVTDQLEGFESTVEVVPTPSRAVEVGKQRSPEGARFPSCYRRLWTFSEEARAVLGERVLLLDIDLVILRDLAPLLERDEDFVGWRPHASWGHPDRVAGGMYLLSTGTRSRVWTDFHGQPSIVAARSAGFRGSDQAWISFVLGKGAPLWPPGSGLYSIRDLKDGRLPLPGDARLVQFNGPQKPWSSRLPWVKQHWRQATSETTA